MSYMLRADATDDYLDADDHEITIEGGYDFDFDVYCSCGKVWNFHGTVSLSYLNRVAEYHRAHYGL